MQPRLSSIPLLIFSAPHSSLCICKGPRFRYLSDNEIAWASLRKRKENAWAHEVKWAITLNQGLGSSTSHHIQYKNAYKQILLYKNGILNLLII